MTLRNSIRGAFEICIEDRTKHLTLARLHLLEFVVLNRSERSYLHPQIRDISIGGETSLDVATRGRCWGRRWCGSGWVGVARPYVRGPGRSVRPLNGAASASSVVCHHGVVGQGRVPEATLPLVRGELGGCVMRVGEGDTVLELEVFIATIEVLDCKRMKTDIHL